MKKIIVCIIALAVVLMVGGFAQAEVSRDGLIAEYLFEGNANDTSGNGNNGTVYGPTLTQDRFGNPDAAYSFDGLGDYIEVPDSDSLDISGAITIEAWVKTAGLVRYGYYVVESRDGSGGGYGINVGSDHIQFWIDSAWPTFDFGIEPLEWHHVVGTYDGSRMIVYVDGVLKSNIPFIAPFKPCTTLYIGQFWGGGFFFHGAIDEVAIWNRVLTPVEVLERYGTVPPVQVQATVDIHSDIFEVKVSSHSNPNGQQGALLSAFIELPSEGLGVGDSDVSTVTLSLDEEELATAESPEVIDNILKVVFYLDLSDVSTLLGLEANKVNVAGGKVKVTTATPPAASIDCIELTVSGDFVDDRGSFSGKDAVRMMMKE